MTIENYDFLIKAEDRELALMAIKRELTDYYDQINQFGKLEDAIKYFDLTISENDNGDVDGLSNDNLLSEHDISMLFNTICPFVEPGSYVEVKTEEHHWRYFFSGKAVEEIFPYTGWECPNMKTHNILVEYPESDLHPNIIRIELPETHDIHTLLEQAKGVSSSDRLDTLDKLVDNLKDITHKEVEVITLSQSIEIK